MLVCAPFGVRVTLVESGFNKKGIGHIQCTRCSHYVRGSRKNRRQAGQVRQVKRTRSPIACGVRPARRAPIDTGCGRLVCTQVAPRSRQLRNGGFCTSETDLRCRFNCCGFDSLLTFHSVCRWTFQTAESFFCESGFETCFLCEIANRLGEYGWMLPMFKKCFHLVHKRIFNTNKTRQIN